MSKFVPIAILTALLAVACADEPARPDATEPTPEAVPFDPSVVEGDALALHVPGMMCETGCAKTVTEMLEGVEGVRKVHVDFPQRMVHVELADGLAAAETVSTAVRTLMSDSAWPIESVRMPTRQLPSTQGPAGS